MFRVYTALQKVPKVRLNSHHYCNYYGGRRNTNYWRGLKGPETTWKRPLIITALTLPFFKSVKSPLLASGPRPALPSTVAIEISRIMLPDDTNSSGNVHGGTILKMMEHAGHVVANRHCNRDREGSSSPITTALVRLEKMDFHQPMLVGEVAQLQAAVTYTSPHSVEVTVDVWAENVITGERRHTNTGSLWYVGILANNQTMFKPCGQLKQMVTSVPQLKGLSQEYQDAGRKRYLAQKKFRKHSNGHGTTSPSATTPLSSATGTASPSSTTTSPSSATTPLSSTTTSPSSATTPPSSATTHVYHYPEEVGEHTVLSSQTTLANIVLPSDCAVTGHMMGGALMKMMDNAAGICAARHSRGRTVTACIDVVDFYQPILNGEMVFVTARIVFTSSKSMEIEVTTEAEGLTPGSRRVTNTAYFTFVCLGEDGSARDVPPLKLGGREEEERFAEGKKRYLARKEARKTKTK